MELLSLLKRFAKRKLQKLESPLRNFVRIFFDEVMKKNLKRIIILYQSATSSYQLFSIFKFQLGDIKIGVKLQSMGHSSKKIE